MANGPMARTARLVELNATPEMMGQMQSVSERSVDVDRWQRGNSTYRCVLWIVASSVEVVAKVCTFVQSSWELVVMV